MMTTVVEYIGDGGDKCGGVVYDKSEDGGDKNVVMTRDKRVCYNNDYDIVNNKTMTRYILKCFKFVLYNCTINTNDGPARK